MGQICRRKTVSGSKARVPENEGFFSQKFLGYAQIQRCCIHRHLGINRSNNRPQKPWTLDLPPPMLPFQTATNSIFCSIPDGLSTFSEAKKRKKGPHHKDSHQFFGHSVKGKSVCQSSLSTWFLYHHLPVQKSGQGSRQGRGPKWPDQRKARLGKSNSLRYTG